MKQTVAQGACLALLAGVVLVSQAGAVDAGDRARLIHVGDIAAVNGKPAKGLWTSRQYAMGFSPCPSPGSAVADVTQGAIAKCKYGILNANGAFIGSLMDGGLARHAVSGGTGAFIGAKGERTSAAAGVVKGIRITSMSEDPANRRSNGGGNTRILPRLISASRPEVVLTANVPAVAHGDGRLAWNANPAQAGEVLSVVRRSSVPNRISNLALAAVTRYETSRGRFRGLKDASAGCGLFL